MNKKVHGRENDKVNRFAREDALGHSVEVVPEVPKSDVALREEDMQLFWEEHAIFRKSLETPAGSEPKGDFVFYDGPPFATGLPHYGHILASTIKDAIPRFWTMNGYRVRRTWGWDCHGLPLENLIEKKLGLATKRDIEAYGIQNFNEAARDAVMEYADEWKRIIPRMGRWADMEDDYKTMDSTYTESVWWVFKSLHEKGLVYEGFKSMHLCPRCGTTLSNFEVNQGYKDIKDIAVTVKLPLLNENGEKTDTSLLVWTTTPWTLPGNLAAAVHNEHEYVTVKVTTEEGDEKVVLAKGRLAQLGDLPYEVLETQKGSELVGTKYEPPFPWLKEYIKKNEGRETNTNQTVDTDKAWVILHADYVELGEEGTGAVHIAPAYGEDDMVLAKEHGVPIVHHVSPDGHFMEFVADFKGQLVKPKDNDDAGVSHLDADIEVIKALKESGKLFKKENVTHSYPHCWRCDTPLLNYATTSWFVEVTKFKDALVAANEKVHWVPEHVGSNRFGRWLEGARDWAVSRQRYWGAPLPIWKNPETGDYKVLGSLKELQEYVPKSGNQYFLMRHGESQSNVDHVISIQAEADDPLTELGQTQANEAIANIPDDIDIIVHTGFVRTQQTAETVIAAMGTKAEVVIEPRLGEIQMPATAQGGKWKTDYNVHFPEFADRYYKDVEGYENRSDVRRRVYAWLKECEAKYSGKKILVISHGGPLLELEGLMEAVDLKGMEELFNRNDYFKNAQVKPYEFVEHPKNDHLLLDYHRPYIDTIELYDGEVKLERVPDVFDCWFESGSMPYGQHHYPFTCDESAFTSKYFPAQFIAEGLDQTRGWFYSLIVLGTALFGKSPYENVIVNGLVLAEDGKKMSKSLQNYPDPMELANRVGVDAMRHYLLAAPIMRGEDLNFSEKEVLELQRKNIGRLHNVLAMYEMFADGTSASDDSDNVLDTWIVARMRQLVAESTAGYKNYELDKATRPITDFIDDLSVWYLRRSRDRLKGDDTEDKARALTTLRYTLRTLALMMAPVMPFYAEYLWQRVKETTDVESVHLGTWPSEGEVDTAVLEAMQQTRDVVTAALEARTKAGLKVRQPIAAVTGPKLEGVFASVVLDELNAKEYKTADEVGIDTTLTQELLAEGAVRELMRAVQGKRKTNNLEPHDQIELTVATNENGKAAIEANQELLTKTVGATTLTFGTVDGELVSAGEFSFTFTITKK